MTTASEYVASRELFNNLTLRELRSKYKRSALGWAWSLVNPLATMVIFTVVFRFFLKIDPPRSPSTGLKNFALFLTCGLLPWNFMTNGVFGSIGALIGNANLIKKTYFPRELLVFAQVASFLVSLLLEMSILLIALVVFGNMVLPWIPVVIVLLLILSLFVTGLGLLFSVANVYFRDVQHFVGIIFQVWFYMTPIVYPLTLVPEKATVKGVELPVRAIYELNPMVRFVQAFRDVLYDLHMPSVKVVAYLLFVSIGTFMLGLWVFGRLEGRLAEEL
jgi:ABC-2 type transport system permease protein